MKPWLFGNTTVRSPLRLRDGLIAIREAGLEGHIRGATGDENLRRCLGDAKVVTLGEDVTASVGRKWRSAMGKLGFLYPDVPFDRRYVGRPDFITPNGERLMDSTVVTGWHEAFLRSLAAYFIPNALEPNIQVPMFSPLRHTLRVMAAIEENTGSSQLHFHEIEAFVQTTSEADDVAQIVSQILDNRAARDRAENMKRFDRQVIERAVAANGGSPLAETYRDYADTNIRYLKATGLVGAAGRGIRFVDVHRSLIERIIADRAVPADGLSYFQTLTNGASLPTDDMQVAREVLEDQLQIAERLGVAPEIDVQELRDVADINRARHEVEHVIFQDRERQFASQQVKEGREIASYLRALLNRRSGASGDVSIPKGEFPAYFEWAVWRTFLAMESMVDRPWEARRFQVDQDLLPAGTAPGNGPDLIFEFDDFVLVIEVTLTSSSRQEAAEGEPVRRHVAAEAEKRVAAGKRVFGLFIAVDIDTNTADTFRMGQWYMKDDTRINLQIVPIRLSDFIEIIDAVVDHPPAAIPHLKELLAECRMESNRDAPGWKAYISDRTRRTAADLRKAREG